VNRRAVKRRRDRIGHIIWRFAAHHMRLFRVEERINAACAYLF
jgi:hypothetical protein